MNRPSQQSPPRAVAHRKWRLRLVVVCVLGFLAVLLLATPTVATAAQESDVGAPQLEEGERVNDTAMRVIIADDFGVNESSVTAEDFALSDGEVASINVSQVGSNAAVILSLTNRVRANNVTVSIAEDGSVSDVSGNTRHDGSVTVTGMDSFAPELRQFDVEHVNDTAVRIVVEADKPLSALQLRVHGPTSTERNLSHFEAVGGSVRNAYTTTYQFPEDGEYVVDLESVRDTSDLLVNLTDSHTFVRDIEDPTAVIDGPRHVDTDDRTRFDASASRDNLETARYEWAIDGDSAGTGDTVENETTVEHTFTEPGTHTLSLTVSDGQENTDTVEQTITVHDAPSKEGVDVRSENESSVHATLRTDRVHERVRIADDYGRLVATDDVELRSLTVNRSTNETTSMNVSANESAPSFVATTGQSDLAAFTIDHGNQSVESPTFRVAISPAALARADISFADVSLYRDDGNWTELETEIVRASRSTVVYEADSPGFSTFVVGRSSTGGTGGNGTMGTGSVPGGEAAINVSSALLHRDTVDFGDLAVVEATLENEGLGTGTSTIAVTVGSETVASRSVTVPAGESRSVEFSIESVESGTVAVDGTVAGELTVLDGSSAASREQTEAASGSNSAENGSSDGDGGRSIPDPLALWPDGLVGTILAAVLGITVSTYAVLKSLAIYLGY